MSTNILERNRPNMLNTEEAAAYLGLAKRTLEGMRWKMNGPKYVKMNKAIRYRVADLDAYIAENTRSYNGI